MGEADMMQDDSDLILEKEVKSNLWSIRPCQLYREEYRDCRSIKSRFQQYFVHGDLLDCSSWENDFTDCERFEDKKDLHAAKRVIESETTRRRERMKAHYGNDVWVKRQSPPEDWAKPLPDYITKEYENSFLELKSKEIKGMNTPSEAANSTMSNSFCTIM